ncbi:hypothetical protein BdWA1_001463 [Babesia duncani]|uniref:Uncharacterized protein n=1 Tax=Babesia duncani TaxID=323732 RepID=A0AAD9PPN9_9APIC|nr:hypothetical protein BdWA1_001463 [Babesia duncani]
MKNSVKAALYIIYVSLALGKRITKTSISHPEVINSIIPLHNAMGFLHHNPSSTMTTFQVEKAIEKAQKSKGKHDKHVALHAFGTTTEIESKANVHKRMPISKIDSVKSFYAVLFVFSAYFLCSFIYNALRRRNEQEKAAAAAHQYDEERRQYINSGRGLSY